MNLEQGFGIWILGPANQSFSEIQNLLFWFKLFSYLVGPNTDPISSNFFFTIFAHICFSTQVSQTYEIATGEISIITNYLANYMSIRSGQCKSFFNVRIEHI